MDKLDQNNFREQTAEILLKLEAIKLSPKILFFGQAVGNLLFIVIIELFYLILIQEILLLTTSLRSSRISMKILK